MKYFKLSINSADSLWRDYRIFGIYFHDDSGSELSVKDLFQKKTFTCPPSIRVLEEKRYLKKKTPDYAQVGTDCLLINSTLIDQSEFDFSGLVLIPVVEKKRGDNYFALCFEQAVDCVNWVESDYERWPDGTSPFPWNNPRGRFFFTPVLYREKIPHHLDVFTLENWDGAFNLIVNEKVKNKLLSLDEAEIFLVFTELLVSSEGISNS